MTDEEARKILLDVSYALGNMGVEYLSEKDGEKMREAIKALEQQPKTIQEKQAESEKYQKAFDDGYENGYAQARFDYEQQPKIGHWICHRDHCENLGVIPSGLGVYEWCSNCDCGIDIREWQRNHYNFCPNCGADMRGDANDQ